MIHADATIVQPLLNHAHNHTVQNEISLLGSTVTMTKTLFNGMILSILLTGCASSGVDRENQNVLISEFYATVEREKPVTLSSEVGTGIAAGAIVGVVETSDGNSEDMIAGGIAGALIGGVITAIAEGSDEAFEYQVNSHSHGKFTIIQKEQLPQTASCVKVRSGQQVTLTPVDHRFCQQPDPDEQSLASLND